MSGLAAVVRRGGGAIEPALLERMARCLAPRGPDGTRTLALGPCGFAHSLLLTGDRPAPAGPFSLPPALFIVCDARLDAATELRQALRGAGEPAPAAAPAAELILHAYRAWELGCLERLSGDFAFALWDAARRRLFAARDALGVKLLYHASPPGAFVFSNTLGCVLQHPGVGTELDPLAIADFLVHSAQLEAHRTPYAAVQALPPGHALVVEDGEVRSWRWWQAPSPAPLRYRRATDYGEHFAEVFGSAVRERLPEGPAAVLMSGGRDSTAVAAFAAASGRPLRAFTSGSSRLLRDEERPWAELAARSLGMELSWQDLDRYRVLQGPDGPGALSPPEPLDAPFLAAQLDQSRDAAAWSRVLLTGYGGDAVLRETPSRLTRLALAGHPLRALREASAYLRHHRRIPRPGVRSWLRRGDRAAPTLPPWLAADFRAQHRLDERLAAVPAAAPAEHPLRPEAVQALGGPVWPMLFASRDPGLSSIPLEVRHPFFDLRVIRFLLSVPPAQWYNDKGVLLLAMRGRLPAPLLRRPKRPLRGDLLEARRRADGGDWLGGRRLGAEVDPFVDRSRVPAVTGGLAEGVGKPLWLNLRPLELSLWLRGRAA